MLYHVGLRLWYYSVCSDTDAIVRIRLQRYEGRKLPKYTRESWRSKALPMLQRSLGPARPAKQRRIRTNHILFKVKKYWSCREDSPNSRRYIAYVRRASLLCLPPFDLQRLALTTLLLLLCCFCRTIQIWWTTSMRRYGETMLLDSSFLRCRCEGWRCLGWRQRILVHCTRLVYYMECTYLHPFYEFSDHERPSERSAAVKRRRRQSCCAEPDSARQKMQLQ